MRAILYQAAQILCDIACLVFLVHFCLVLFDLSCGRPPTFWPLRAGIALAACIDLLKLEEICEEETEYAERQDEV